jgi:hypothetical protein
MANARIKPFYCECPENRNEDSIGRNDSLLLRIAKLAFTSLSLEYSLNSRRGGEKLQAYGWGDDGAA